MVVESLREDAATQDGLVGYVPGKPSGDGRRRPPGLALRLGIILLTGASTAAAQTAPPTIDDLIAKAARQGTLRVIVELKTDPPGPPSSPEAIAQAQDLVLQELGGTGHRVLRHFATIPFLGLEVTPEALRRLAASAHVAGVREDIVLRPQGSPASP